MNYHGGAPLATACAPERSFPPMDRYVVIGNPVSHSLSPAIHAHFAAQRGEAMEFATLLVPLDRFEVDVKRFFDTGGKGANVTLPFKVNAYRWAGMRSEWTS